MSETRVVTGGRPLRGTVRVPGDKSISHRAVLLASIAHGESELFGLGLGQDVLATIGLVDSLGINIEVDDFDTYYIQGCAGIAPAAHLDVDCANSGTTARVGLGLLAGLGVSATIDGDASLRTRPMRRVVDPLRSLGAQIELTEDERLPLSLGASQLQGGTVTLQSSSAQVRTALAFAGLHSQGTVIVDGPTGGRDHTERLFGALGLPIAVDHERFSISGAAVPSFQLDVAGDPSSAAFFLIAAAFVADSDCVVEGMCINPTRLGFLEVLQGMGARVHISHAETRLGEPIGDVRVQASELTGVDVDRELIPSLIDEIPALAVAAAFARGSTSFRGAEELAVKESNRIESTAQLVRALGATVEVHDDGLTIHGMSEPATRLAVAGSEDHRIAMAAGIAAAGCSSASTLTGTGAVEVSYPAFWSDLNMLMGVSG